MRSSATMGASELPDEDAARTISTRHGEELLMRVKSLIEKNYSVLLSRVRHQYRDAQFAGDLVNEAIAITLAKIRSGTLRDLDDGKITAYVISVTFNLARNHYRSRHNRAELRLDSRALESLALPGDRDEAQDRLMRRLALEVIQSLSARDREIIRRHYIDEEDGSTICRELGIAPLTYNIIIWRARRRMKSLLESKGLTGRDLF